MDSTSVSVAIKRLIRVHSDSSIVVCCLNRGGSARSIALWSWTLSIVNLLETKGWFLTVVHMKGVSNILSDTIQGLPDHNGVVVCRQFSMNPESQLETPSGFICHQIKSKTVNVSPILDKVIRIDAFRIDWNSWKTIYLFPSVKMLSQAHKLEFFQGLLY